jgi:tryptophan synthase alpha chain
VSRYDALFARNQGAFGAFVMLGDPEAPPLDELIEAGADMLELGIPFSDPIADGPVIQAAARRALERGWSVQHSFDLLAEVRDRHPEVPIGLLTYANLVMARGLDTFYRSAADAGVYSVLVADVRVIAAAPFAAAARAHGVAPVLIAAANTAPARLRQIAALGEGYTYCVARAGVTGAEEARFDHFVMLGTLRAAGAPPPIFGFGISTPAHVRAALEAGAAGVICGSAIVARGRAAAAFVREMKAATF